MKSLACLEILLITCLFSGYSIGNESATRASNDERIVSNRYDIQPLVYLEPIYPSVALSNGIEGYCKASFDIDLSSISKPQNIEILECSPKDYFEKSCVDAISKWIFKGVKSAKTEESGNGLITTCNFKVQ